jgi:hypothetical protein
MGTGANSRETFSFGTMARGDVIASCYGRQERSKWGRKEGMEMPKFRIHYGPDKKDVVEATNFMDSKDGTWVDFYVKSASTTQTVFRVKAANVLKIERLKEEAS